MAEEVVISSMRNSSEAVEDVKVADVKALFDTHVNAGKVIVVVEGSDDKEVYEKLTDSASSICPTSSGSLPEITTVPGTASTTNSKVSPSLTFLIRRPRQSLLKKTSATRGNTKSDFLPLISIRRQLCKHPKKSILTK